MYECFVGAGSVPPAEMQSTFRYDERTRNDKLTIDMGLEMLQVGTKEERMFAASLNLKEMGEVIEWMYLILD